jgi:cytochrome c biogenesis protein ResB
MNTRAILKQIRRMFNFLASGRLAVVLLAVLAVLLGVFLLVPQFDSKDSIALNIWLEANGALGRLTQALGLVDVQHSWLLFGTYGLLFVNLLFCMIRRFRRIMGSFHLPTLPPDVSALWLHRQLKTAGNEIEHVADIARRKGYRTIIFGNTVYGLRGRFAKLGHWIFHVSFLVILAGGMWVAATPEVFRGTVGIGEGEPFDLYRAPFLATNIPISRELQSLRFKMEEIDVSTEGEEVRRFEARVSTPEGRQTVIGINRPFRKRPYQVLLTGFGYMPGWAVINPRGRMIRGAWIKMVPFPQFLEDSFSIGPETSTVNVRFFPDYHIDGKEIRTLSYELKKPKFEARILWRGEQVFEGLLEPGQRVDLGDGRQFFFLQDIRKYGMLDVMREQGHEIIFTGLVIMVLGILIRYAMIRKEIIVRVGAESLHLYGRSEILTNLFAEEFEQMAKELDKTGPSPRKGGD